MTTAVHNPKKVLVIAPQPFFQERGTPIAVRLLVEILCANNYSVDLLTYHEGEDVGVNDLRIFRIRRPPFIKSVSIGFSWQKLICDFFLWLKMTELLQRNDYEIVHAVEEAIFPAGLLKQRYRFRLVYDIDSSLADQMIEKYSFLKKLAPIFLSLEKFAVRRADLLLPVCKTLADKFRRFSPSAKITVLHDIPMPDNGSQRIDEKLKNSNHCRSCTILYVGNLEPYQGVDLMLEAMALLPKTVNCCFVAIGGQSRHLALYRQLTVDMGIADRVQFLGPRPLKSLYAYLTQADILASPRKKGQNTPMKIYSYLASGKPVLATAIESHTQVMDPSNAMLVEPSPQAISAAIQALVQDADLRRRLGQAGKALVDKDYSLKAFQTKLLNAYNRL